MRGKSVGGVVLAVVISIAAVVLLALIALVLARFIAGTGSSRIGWGDKIVTGSIAEYMGVLWVMIAGVAVLTYVIARYFV